MNSILAALGTPEIMIVAMFLAIPVLLYFVFKGILIIIAKIKE
jgi:hypothetical protein